MNTNGEHENGEQSFEYVRTPGVSHEHRDASFRAVMSFAIGMVIAAGVIQLVVWGMLRYFDQMRLSNAVPTHSQFGGPYPPPAAPRIQADPVHDMNLFRASEERILNSYTWTDDGHTAVRIPIERAKQMLLERGLPVTASPSIPAPIQLRPNGPSPALAAQATARAGGQK